VSLNSSAAVQDVAGYRLELGKQRSFQQKENNDFEVEAVEDSMEQPRGKSMYEVGVVLGKLVREAAKKRIVGNL